VAAAAEAVSGAAFKVFPRVDQGETFATVHEALKAGDRIGIFPEGGSHDQTGLLDLKPGVAIMALGAMAEGSAPVHIVPCGLTYFEPQRFRSRAIVEFGEPVSVPVELAERYRTDKRGAVAELMSAVEDALTAVVPRAANYKELQALITMKALYKPRDRKLSPQESLQLTKNFTTAATKLHSDERMRKVVHDIELYNGMLRAAGMRDRDVRRSTDGRNFTLRALCALLQVLLLAPVALPAMLLSIPVGLMTALLAEKERKKALAGSTVKVKAVDVVASYKILVALVIVPLYNLLLAIVVTWFSGLGLWMFPAALLVQPVLAYVLILVCDHFVRCVKHCAAIMHFQCSCSGAFRRLEEQRGQLKERVAAIVEELGPEIYGDFEAVRVIKRERLQDIPTLAEAEPAAHVLDAGGLFHWFTPGTRGGTQDPLLEKA